MTNEQMLLMAQQEHEPRIGTSSTEEIEILRAKLANAERLIREHQKLFALTFDMICIAGFDGYFKWVNAAFPRTLGYSEEELLSKPFEEFVHPEDRNSTSGELDKLSHTGHATIDFENRYRCYDGTYKWISWRSIPVPEEQLVYATARDVTEKKATEFELIKHRRDLEAANQELAKLASLDPLTELANLRMFKTHIDAAIRRAERYSSRGALLFLDLDGFKVVNDRLGHAIGDALLKAIAARLRATVRKSDLIGRLGGDEFAVLLEGIPSPTNAELVANKLVTAVTSPFTIAGHDIRVGLSVGISIFEDSAVSIEKLIEMADIAMYAAKSSGGNCARYYEPTLSYPTARPR